MCRSFLHGKCILNVGRHFFVGKSGINAIFQAELSSGGRAEQSGEAGRVPFDVFFGVHGDAAGFEGAGEEAVAGDGGVGEGAVVDAARAAGGAAGFEDGAGDGPPFEGAEGPAYAFAVEGGEVAPVGGDDAARADFYGRTGRGEDGGFGADGEAVFPVEEAEDGGAAVVAAVVFAALPEEAGADEDERHGSVPFVFFRRKM